MMALRHPICYLGATLTCHWCSSSHRQQLVIGGWVSLTNFTSGSTNIRVVQWCFDTDVTDLPKVGLGWMSMSHLNPRVTYVIK